MFRYTSFLASTHARPIKDIIVFDQYFGLRKLLRKFEIDSIGRPNYLNGMCSARYFTALCARPPAVVFVSFFKWMLPRHVRPASTPSTACRHNADAMCNAARYATQCNQVTMREHSMEKTPKQAFTIMSIVKN